MMSDLRQYHPAFLLMIAAKIGSYLALLTFLAVAIWKAVTGATFGVGALIFIFLGSFGLNLIVSALWRGFGEPVERSGTDVS